MNRTSFLLIFSLFIFPLFSKSFEGPFEVWDADSEICLTFSSPPQHNLPCKSENTLLPSLHFSTNAAPMHIKTKMPLQFSAKKIPISLVQFFQKFISPIDGPRSTFYPTSSQYMIDAIERHGALKGIALGCDRLMRENPDIWVYDRIEKYGHSRKYDPVR